MAKDIDLHGIDAREKIINFKVSLVEYAKISDKAGKHFRGNISAWCRYASNKYRPTTEDIKYVRAAKKYSK